MFYIGANDQIMQVGKVMFKAFKGGVELFFPLIDPDLGYW